MTLSLATDDTGDAEIFASLQGEGLSAGQPVAFVRLSRCNLACVWCDTAYTWRFDDTRPHRGGVVYDRAANQLRLPVTEVAARIAALGQNRLVVTGGEPLLQGAALARLAELLPGVAIEIETNGTVPPHPALNARVAHYTVSPKLAHSGNPAALALPPDRLAGWAGEPRAYLKFVIAEPEDMAEAIALVDRYGFDRARVFVMPEGTDSDTLRTRERWLAPLALHHGLRLSDRLHIHLYGDTRGT